MTQDVDKHAFTFTIQTDPHENRPAFADGRRYYVAVAEITDAKCKKFFFSVPL